MRSGAQNLAWCTAAGRITTMGIAASGGTSPGRVFVLGNESADLDSIVCSICVARARKGYAIMNTTRTELPLRRDVTKCFALCNVTDEVTFADEVNVEDKDEIVLVDHNALAVHQQDWTRFVSGVIDHHEDEGVFLEAKPRVIEKTGSCATLVSEVLKDAVIDESSARLLLCAILQDSSNMQPGGKGVPRDGAAIERLAGPAGWDATRRAEVYEVLKQAKKDTSGMSVLDLLRKDAKTIEGGGVKVVVCSVGMSWDELQGRGDVAEKMMEMKGVADCVIVMNSFGGKKHQRQLNVLGNSVGRRIAPLLRQEEILQLEAVASRDGSELDQVVRFEQRNAKASRKIVAPVLRRVLLELHV